MMCQSRAVITIHFNKYPETWQSGPHRMKRRRHGGCTSKTHSPAFLIISLFIRGWRSFAIRRTCVIGWSNQARSSGSRSQDRRLAGTERVPVGRREEHCPREVGRNHFEVGRDQKKATPSSGEDWNVGYRDVAELAALPLGSCVDECKSKRSLSWLMYLQPHRCCSRQSLSSHASRRTHRETHWKQELPWCAVFLSA